jgi:DNA topoisomerase-3
MGRPFAAMVRLSDEGKPEFDFGQNEKDAEPGEEPDFSGQEPLGKCPQCGGRVFEHGMSYLCEHGVTGARSCKFRSGKVILQRSIERAQMVRLLETGKTELLHKFISKKGRPFSAFLVVGKDGKVGFEFAPREAKKKKTKSVVSRAPSSDAGKSEGDSGVESQS